MKLIARFGIASILFAANSFIEVHDRAEDVFLSIVGKASLQVSMDVVDEFIQVLGDDFFLFFFSWLSFFEVSNFREEAFEHFS